MPAILVVTRSIWPHAVRLRIGRALNALDGAALCDGACLLQIAGTVFDAVDATAAAAP